MPVMEGQTSNRVNYYKAPPKYATPKTSYTPKYREEPYDNSGAMRAAEQARLIREAQQRQAAQLAAQRQAEAVQLAAQQRAARSRISLGGGANTGDIRNAWNSYTGAIGQNWNTTKDWWKNNISPSLGTAFTNIVKGSSEADYQSSNILRQMLGYPAIESWQRPGVGTPQHTYNDYDRAGNYAGGNYPWMQPNYYDAYTKPGWADDWGMSQSGAIGNQFGGGQLDRANWGRGVPTWDEILMYADPNASNPYDLAGHPGDTPVDVNIPGGGYGDYGGYGSGSYSSKPGYYGGGQSYAKNYYNNLLQWNI